MSSKVYVVQGLQYGSEAKGAVIGWLAGSGRIAHCVRTGSINAGHTVYHNGVPHKMQQIPAAWVNPGVTLYIGPGAYIHPETLQRELHEIGLLDPGLKDRLIIDSRAGIHHAGHERVAKDVNRHHSIGATGKGCAESIIDKIALRGLGGMLFVDWIKQQQPKWAEGLQFGDVPLLLNRALVMDQNVWIEGTQGTGLDLHTGPYPYTTSRMTTAANWVAESGLSPALDIEVLGVVRTYPIRVAGNSGPMEHEIQWSTLWEKWRGVSPAPQVSKAAQATFYRMYKAAYAKIGATSGENAAKSEAFTEALSQIDPVFAHEVISALELTTVTHKPRRIAEIDYKQLFDAAVLERPSRIALTFLNYKFPELWGCTDRATILNHKGALRYIDNMGERMGAPVWLVSTGPESKHMISVGPML